MAPLLVAVIGCCMLSHVLAHGQHDHDAKFLMVLFDGFRWDYLDFDGLENFQRFQRLGLRADYMETDYPSLSFPGYYTILTGLHSESHGFIGNDMYDPQRNKYFDTYLGHDSNEPFWWEQAEPLWTAAVRTGRKTHVYLWPGCHVPIHNMLPDFVQPYRFVGNTQQLEENLGDVVKSFATGVADVAFVYDEYPDHIGHAYGPDSAQIRGALSDLDRVLGTFLDDLEKANLTDKVNIIFVSDHGMSTSNPEKTTYIHIEDVIDLDDVELIVGSGVSMRITPAPGKLDKVYEALKRIQCFHVWKKEDIPEKLHYKHNDRVPPILLTVKRDCIVVAAPSPDKQFPFGYYGPDNTPKGEPKPKPTGITGRHGYLPSENKDMRAIFMAAGPAFVKNRRVPAIHATDVYNLALHAMNINGHPNNGTWSHVSGMLIPETSHASASSSPKSHCLFSSMVSCVVFLFVRHFAFRFLFSFS